MSPHVSHGPLQNGKPAVDVLGVRVSVAGLGETVEHIVQLAGGALPNGGPAYACATSVHGVIEATRDPAFRKILNRAAFITADGMPLVWFGRLAGYRSMERVYGPTLMNRVCARAAETGIGHFFYGGAPGVAEDLAEVMARRFPGLQVAGTYCPPFRPLTAAEPDAVAETINESKADLVWVGLSTPRQERWIHAIRSKLRAKMLVSVGAAFDFHTGRARQAPEWIQPTGLEWLFRLVQEPRRLWRRYAYNNPRFLWLAALQLAGIKKFKEN